MEISSLLSTIKEAENYIQSKIKAGALSEIPVTLFEDLELAQKAVLECVKNDGFDTNGFITFSKDIISQPDLVLKRMQELDKWCLHFEQNKGKSHMKIRNSVDIRFYEMMETIRCMDYETILLHLKNGFEKLDDKRQQKHVEYYRRFQFWGLLEPKENNYQLLENRAEALCNHLEDFLWLYGRLGDHRSKLVLLATLSNWFSYDYSLLEAARETSFNDYFDLDLIKVTKEEVFVDLGAFIGDTVNSYVQSYGPDSYKKIYCYEITPATFHALQNNLKEYPNIEYRMKGASDSHGVMYITANDTDSSANILTNNGNIEVQTVPIDDDITEPITFIKMDIEGFEQKALLGCAKHIQSSHPKLALSVYHNNEDLWKIPRMIDEICPGYKFYLRYHGGNLSPTETTLIALYQ